MDVTALCIRLLVDVLVLLVAHVDHSYLAQKADAGFPRVSPNRLQFFEYETVSVNCEEFSGSSEWRVMRKLSKIIPTNSSDWNSSVPSCTIYPAFERHSGEYWCEDAEGQRSEAVNITVTAGSVILESPAHPVLEGHDVILHCINKNTQSQHIPEYYKDGVHLGTFYKSIMTVQNVSKSDEGLYKCSIPGAGESPQSRLAVLKQSKVSYEERHPTLSHPPQPLSLLWVAVFVTLLLLVMGLHVCREHRERVVGAGTKPDQRVYSTVYYRPLTPSEGLELSA